MSFDEAQYRSSVQAATPDDAELSWSSLAKSIQGVVQSPAMNAIGQTALKMAPSVLQGAAGGALTGGLPGALLGAGGAVFSNLTSPKKGPPARAPAPPSPAPGVPQAQQAPAIAGGTPVAAPSVQGGIGQLLQLLQNPQVAGLVAALGGGGAAALAGAGAGDGERQTDEEGIYDFLVESGLATEG